MSATDVYYRRGFDHLKTIARTLQNLRGAGALAHELIQNADDAAEATELTFRFTREGLEVVDNGGFESCGRLSEPTCPWEHERRRTKKKKRCDFHAFQQLAGASKENDPDLTGAFGVGFLSVYQVTDRPELFSAGQHWIIDETRREDQRIRGCAGCDRPHIAEGTSFLLPWADQRSDMREQLASDPVPPSAQQRLYRDFCRSVPSSMVFLHKLRLVTVEHYQHKPLSFTREVTEQGVRIVGEGLDERWLVFEGGFSEEADRLRQEHPQIGSRHSRVRVAVLPRGSVKGLLHATLPTQILTGLPVHVDASFFPRIDRKGILLEGFEGDWNRAAIERAAELLAVELDSLAHPLGPKPIWRLIRDAYAGRDRSRRGAGDSLGVFWEAIRRVLPDARVMPTSRGTWAAVNETVLPGRKDSPEWLALLDDLGVDTVAESVRSIVADMGRAVPTATLDLRRLLDALGGVGVDEGPFSRAELPAGLASEKRRNLLRRRLNALAAADPGVETDRLRGLAIWRTTKRTYDSLTASYLVARDTARLFGSVIEHPLIDVDAQDNACADLLGIGDRWGTDAALKALASDDRTLPTDSAHARELLDWLTRHKDEIDPSALTTLHDRSIVPTRLGLRPPALSVIAGGFDDPLEVAAEVDPDVAKDHLDTLRSLGVAQLSFSGYIRDFVPAALEHGATTPALLRLLDVCTDHRRDIDDDAAVRAVLSQEAWVPCRDGYLRPPAGVYFDTPLVRAVLGDRPSFLHGAITVNDGRADLLRALGANTTPRPEDVVSHVQELTRETPDEQTVAGVVAVLRHIQSATDRVGFAGLKSVEWLPTDDGRAWAAPSSLYFTRERHLFATSGRFIALPRKDQDALRSVLSDLGVRQTPSPALVVDHLLNLVRSDLPLDERVVAWLNADRHWTDDAVGELRGHAWLATTTGSLASPAEVFRSDHPLTPYLPALDPSLRRFVYLLDALGVRTEPSSDDAVNLLLRLSREAADPPTSEERRVVRACWRQIDLATVTALDRLLGQPVALGGDNQLHRCDELLLNDLPNVAKTFDTAVQGRLVRHGETDAILREVGVRMLSECIRSRVTETGVPVDADRVSQRILTRPSQLARIVGRDGGKWADVLELTRALHVDAYEWLSVERYIDGFPELEPTPPANVAAHYLGDGQLVVAIAGNRPDWFEIASCLREILFPPTASPSIASAIEEVLVAGSGTDADRRLSRLGYAELDAEQWEELQAALEEQRARAQAAAAHVAADPVPVDEEHELDEGATLDEHEASRGGEDQADRDTSASHPDGRGNGDLVDREDTVPNRAPTAAAEDDAPQPDTPSGDDREGSSDDDAVSTPSPRQVVRPRRDSGVAPAQRNNGDRPGSRRPARSSAARRRDGSASSRDGQEWWYSVVSAHKPETDTSDIDVYRQAGRRTAIDAAGMKAVTRHESAAGRHPKPQPPNNPGYDIDSTNEAGQTLRYIEVKSLAGEWGTDGFPKLTPTQWTMALAERDMYWLYVVEHAESAEPVITRIQDPAGATTRYVVDPGWRALGEPDARTAEADADDLDLVDDAVRTLCLDVMHAGGPPPAVLVEVGTSGVVIEAAWPQRAVGLVSPGSTAAADGWRIVRADEIDATDLLAMLNDRT